MNIFNIWKPYNRENEEIKKENEKLKQEIDELKKFEPLYYLVRTDGNDSYDEVIADTVNSWLNSKRAVETIEFVLNGRVVASYNNFVSYTTKEVATSND